MTIAVIGAMDVEISSLCKKFGAVVAEKGIFTASCGTISLVIAQCGVGKVNAAALTQKLIDLYAPEIIINSGCAGALGKDMEIGEIVISSFLAYHDFNPLDMLDNYPPFSKYFYADEKLVAIASQVCRENGWRYRVGPVVTGDCFVSSDAQKADINSRFGAECTEMEGAAIAQVCLLNQVRFLVIRSVSDFADNSAERVNKFEAQAAEHASIITETILHQIERD